MFPTGRTGLHNPSRPQADFNEPGHAGDGGLEVTNLHKVLETLKMCPISSESGDNDIPCHRPGSSHRRYRKPDELVGAIKTFHEKAAKVAGISLPTLLAAVYTTETKMAQLASASRV